MSYAMPTDDADLVLQPIGLESIQLTEGDLAAAAQGAGIEPDPERAWTRYLRALVITALKAECERRRVAVVIGPLLDPEEPDRLLAINGRATQLVCVSSMADFVEVPTKPWQVIETAPQLLLVAQVDEEQGVVEFPGVLAGAAVVAELRRQQVQGDVVVELPIEQFNGQLGRLLRWVTLLEPEALRRVGLVEGTSAGTDDPLASLRQWLAELLSSAALIPLPVLGTRGGAVPELRLITPQVQRANDGSAFAEAVCATPSIWADGPLAEVVIEQEGKVVWQQLATRRNPIDGPIAWPLEPLLPKQQFIIRLRPFGTAGGAYASFILSTTNVSLMQEGEEAVGLEWGEWLESRPDELLGLDRRITAEVQARRSIINGIKG